MKIHHNLGSSAPTSVEILCNYRIYRRFHEMEEEVIYEELLKTWYNPHPALKKKNTVSIPEYDVWASSSYEDSLFQLVKIFKLLVSADSGNVRTLFNMGNVQWCQLVKIFKLLVSADSGNVRTLFNMGNVQW